MCDNLITLPSPGTVTAHAPCHVTCAQGVPPNHMKQFFDPELSIHYTTFMGLR